MAPFYDNALIGAAGGAGGSGYQISRSLRFNSADSAYLSRTPSVAGNRKTWTWSGWVKRSALGTAHLFACTIVNSDSQYLRLIFNGDQLQFSAQSSVFRRSTALFRDTSAWQHIVCALDTTQATAANRVKLYVNGLQLTDFSVSADPTLNADLGINQAAAHTVGGESAAATKDLNAYLADIHFIDGQALTPSSFGETDANTGEWIPKAYNGTYGTNGFKLNFADNSAATAAALGKDTSGNGNNWTPNNLSVTAGAGNDSLVDTPTSYGTDTGVGGEARGNYCTLNPLNNPGGSTLSDGNLQCVTPSTGLGRVNATFAVSSGKWYWEITLGSGGLEAVVGIVQTTDYSSGYVGSTATSYGYYAANGSKTNSSSPVAYGASCVANDIISVALDLDAGTLTFFKNGASQGVAFSGLTGTFFPSLSDGNGAAVVTMFVNFGQRPFAYTAPSGFKALCDTNLSAPTIVKPSTVMDVLAWTGDGSANRAFTGLGFSPDFVWGKVRSTAGYDHQLYDSVRGAGNDKELCSNNTAAEGASTNVPAETFGYLTSFDSSGFSTAAGTSSNSFWNSNGSAYAAWCWDAGSSTVTNTAGTISSQVRANASAGFSIVTYTGTGANATVGHGLGVAPGLVIVKSRGANLTNWGVWHSTFAGTEYALLSTTGAKTTDATMWNSTAPSSSVFSLGTNATVNQSTYNYVAYCFAPVAGYSAFGSYTGNANADGPFVYTGFRPRWVMVKCSSTGGTNYDWTIFDAARIGYNVDNDPLYANLASAEGTNDFVDVLSNGFKIRGGGVTWNVSGGTYIYAAFAESPFAYSRAR